MNQQGVPRAKRRGRPTRNAVLVVLSLSVAMFGLGSVASLSGLPEAEPAAADHCPVLPQTCSTGARQHISLRTGPILLHTGWILTRHLPPSASDTSHAAHGCDRHALLDCAQHRQPAATYQVHHHLSNDTWPSISKKQSRSITTARVSVTSPLVVRPTELAVQSAASNREQPG